MENLNAEAVKKALECCLTTSEGDCIACGYRGKKDGLFITCTNCLIADALALINSQEQRIAAQDMTISELRQRCEKAEHDADRYAQRIKELTEEVAEEKEKGEMCAEVIKRQDKEIAQKDAEIKRLREACDRSDLLFRATARVSETTRNETIDEFADMVKEKMREVATGKRTSLVGIGWLDQIVKELKGE